MPEVDGVRIIDLEPMSDRVPMSDAVLAQLNAADYDRLHTLKQEMNNYTADKMPWALQDAYTKIERRLAKRHREHSREVEMFDNWLNAGRPELT